MAHLSVRLPDSVISELNAWAIHKSKAEVIREALDLYRRYQVVAAKKARLTQASFLVRGESMAINKEFGAMEEDVHEA